ncbi:phage portal protein [Ureibacillus composti]|nr:phage portal protein [Ureibacillus composti]
MGLFEKMFGKKVNSQPSTQRFELINDDRGGFYNWNGNLYKSDIIRSAIRPEVTAIGKLVAKHIQRNSRGLKINPNENLAFLLKRPNPIMSMQVFQEKMAVQLALNHNAFAYIVRDEMLNVTAIYPLPASSVEVKEGVLGDMFLKFYFNNGKIMTIPYDDVIHLRRDFNNDDFFADHPGEALLSLMEIVNTTDQGVIKAIKNSAVIKWLLKFKSVLKDDDMIAQVKKFNANYLSIDNKNGGAAATDSRYDLEQVKNEAYVPDDKQATNTIQRVYSFFNTNDDIVQSKYDENKWNAWYEARIEPVAMQFSSELTFKIFSRVELRKGHEIIFETSSLQYASMQTKLSLEKMVDRGALTPNEWRTILNLPSIDGGDKPIRRLDTALVSNGNVVKGGEADGKNGTKGNNNAED